MSYVYVYQEEAEELYNRIADHLQRHYESARHGATNTRPPDFGVAKAHIPQHEPGAKLDDGKPDASLLQQFPRALLQVALVGTMGQKKYTRGGWQYVYDGVARYTAAMTRHFLKESEEKYDQDPWYDTEEGAGYKNRIRHDAQVAWNALARLELTLRGEEEANNGRNG